MAKKKYIPGRLAIATALGTDFETITPYQPRSMDTHKLFTDGDRIFVSIRNGDELPTGSTWEKVAGTEWFSEKHGIKVFYEVQEERTPRPVNTLGLTTLTAERAASPKTLGTPANVSIEHALLKKRVQELEDENARLKSAADDDAMGVTRDSIRELMFDVGEAIRVNLKEVQNELNALADGKGLTDMAVDYRSKIIHQLGLVRDALANVRPLIVPLTTI